MPVVLTMETPGISYDYASLIILRVDYAYLSPQWEVTWGGENDSTLETPLCPRCNHRRWALPRTWAWRHVYSLFIGCTFCHMHIHAAQDYLPVHDGWKRGEIAGSRGV